MRFSLLTISLLLLPLSLEARDMVEVSQAVTDEAETLCRQLMDNARSIDAILHSVTDKDSADKAAAPLAEDLKEMKALLAALEQLPFDAETTVIITARMMSLTHITQSYMPVLQQLKEKNAYGSDTLMAQLNSYNPEDEGSLEQEQELSPYDALYRDIQEALSNAVYVLRKTNDASTAKEAALTVRDSLILHRCRAEELSVLQNVEPQNSLYPVSADKLPQLKAEIISEYERLKEAFFYGDPDLPLLLEEYLHLIP